jgi:ankyrin repeat protein
MAVRAGNKEVAKKLYLLRPENCLKGNFKGQSPIFLATQMQDLEMLEIFNEYKYEALMKKDYLGENPLFECARNGNEAIFNWFTGDNNFYKARG